MGKCIGIDLGTTNSLAAVLRPDIDVINNPADDKKLMRSCVGWNNNELIVGNEIFNLTKMDPANMIFSIKRLMGTSINNPNVQKVKNKFKYGIIKKTLGTEDTLAVLLNGKEYLPEEISAEILKKIKTYAESYLNDTVTHAVITVPAYFTEKQKYATLVAAKLAGIMVQKLLPEPTAAAIAYCAKENTENSPKTFLVYDFGGGTFDVSIISYANGQYLEIAKGGDNWLGGDDIDELLIQYVKKRIETEYSIDSVDNLISAMKEEKGWKANLFFKIRVEEAKIILSKVNSVNFDLTDLIKDENGDYLEINFKITRDQFEELITPTIKRSIEATKALFQKANYDNDMIDEIILVGGSSKIPLVMKMLKEEFGDKVRYSFDPMFEVAIGAAIVAQRSGNEDLTSEVPEVIIKEKYRFSEITHTIAHDIYLKVGEEGKEEIHKIFEATQPYPAEKKIDLETLYPNQRIAKFGIFSDGDEGGISYSFINLKNNYPAHHPIHYTLFLDTNETMEITVNIEGESKNSKFRLSRGTAHTLATTEIDNTIRDINQKGFSQDKIIKAIDKLQLHIERISLLAQDGSGDDKQYAEIIYTAGEIPNELFNEKIEIDNTQKLKNLLNWVNFVIDSYSAIMAPTVFDDLRRHRDYLIKSVDNMSIEEVDNINNTIDEIVKRDQYLDLLIYIKIATFYTKDEVVIDKINECHDKIIFGMKQNNEEAIKNNFDIAMPMANDIYSSIGSNDKIRTSLGIKNGLSNL